jgi:hexosaminidase
MLMNNRMHIAHLPLLSFLILLCSLITHAQVAVIPQPATVRQGDGNFELSSSTHYYASTAELAALGNYLAEQLSKTRGFELRNSSTQSSSMIVLQINQKKDSRLGDEGYKMSVKKSGITISANNKAGIFYGIQSLLQLLPSQLKGSEKVTTKCEIPAVEIEDFPRFAWRGIMLDVSRHFFPKEYILKYIDQLAAYKYNRLHLHLTDDNGWRIEIKSYPKLTSIGAWRVPRTGTFGRNEPPKPGEKPTYGGFYTQDDIREIVAYAKSRYIEILPEIDVPGHSMAALAAYPELSVTRDSTVKVNPGSSFSTWHGNGKFTMHLDNTLNPTDEKVYDFIDKVVGEIAALFPFEYLHLGGDECYKGYWERDAKVQAFMKKNKIANGHDLQAYFTNRVNTIVKSKGKKMIGWDEIIEGELSKDAAVMSWQGTKGGIAATKRKHTVVMSPAPHYYLDMMQGDASIEPPVYNTARLKDTYHFDIVPAEADSSFIIGGQGNLWTEQVPTPAQVEYMTYPRAFAIAETLWSPSDKKNWPDFVSRTERHLERLKQAKINYAESMYDPIIKVRKENENLLIELSSEVDGLDLYYTLDNSVPNNYHQKYTEPIKVLPEVDNFRVISYRDGKPLGRLISLKREDLDKRIRK